MRGSWPWITIAALLSGLWLAVAAGDEPGGAEPGDDDDSAGPAIPEEGSPAATESAESAVVRMAPPRPVHEVDDILVDWEELEWQARAIYLARVSQEPREEYPYDWCFDPVKAVHPNPGIPLPRELCMSPWDVPSDLPDQEGPAAAWVVTVGRDEEAVYAAQHCGETTDACGALARESVVEMIRCWQLNRIWAEIPEPATRCAQDEHCTLFLAAGNCFRRAVSTLVAEPYQELLERFGPPCGYSIMGQCPDEDWRVKCREGYCRIEDRNAPPPPPVPVEPEGETAP